MSDYLGSHAAQALELLFLLSQLGTAHELNLPRIIVAGKQSVGKSSILERITAILLPRAGGTCTRCSIKVQTHIAEGDDHPYVIIKV